MKRVFKRGLEIGETCGGKMKVIACIEDPAVIKRLLAHLEHCPGTGQHPEHPPRAATTYPARTNGVDRRRSNTQGRWI